MMEWTPERVTAIREQLWRCGFRPVALCNHDDRGPSPGKRPVGQGWQHDARKDPPRWAAEPAQQAALNTGVLADALRVVDIDIDDASLAVACVKLAETKLGPAPVRYRKNSARKLLLYRAANGEPSKRETKGPAGKVEVLGKGQQFVAYGIHDTGAEIEWAGEPPGLITVDDLQAITEEQVGEFLAACAPIIGANDTARRGNGQDHDHEPVDSLDVAAALSSLSNGGGGHDALVRLAGLFAAQGVSAEAAEAILLHAIDQRPPEGRDEGWSGLRADVRRTVHWAREKEAPYAHLLASAGGNGGTPPPPSSGPSSGPQPGPGPQPHSHGKQLHLLRNKRSKHACNVVNAVACLENLSQLAGCVAFDEMARAVSLRLPLPGMTNFTGPRPWTDDDTSQLQMFLQGCCAMLTVSREVVQQAVETVARKHGFHPVRDYLNGLTWDGTPRIGGWLTNYLNVPDSEYAQATGRMWLIGMVARIMRPGCKFDHLLILEGPQGVGKSLTARILCDPWVSDRSLDICGDARAASQHLRGLWLHEISELASFRPGEVEAIKAFISRTEERYLPRYGRNEVIEPRQCGFLGTTNRQVCLNDPTGGRRFWTHSVGDVRLRALAQDRDQIWAESLAAYRAGERWWPTREFEQAIIKPQQDDRYEEDGWQPLIAEYLANKAQVSSLLDVFRNALRDPHDPFHPALAPEKFDRRAQLRVREILENLGWRRSGMTHGRRRWIKP